MKKKSFPALSLTAFIAGFLWMVIFNLRPIRDPDIWWHLSSGRWMLVQKAIPYVDVFSLTAQGTRWVDTYWLQEITWFLVCKLAGLPGVIIFNALLVALVIFLIVKKNTES